MASLKEIIADEAAILELIPQKPPMVMVGKLHSTGDGKTVTSLIIREDNLFCENGVFLEAGLIENMAQTAAAGVGYHASILKKAPPVGFIGGVKNLKIHARPVVGDEIITTITVEHQVFDATVAMGVIAMNGQTMAEGELKIFLMKDAAP